MPKGTITITKSVRHGEFSHKSVFTVKAVVGKNELFRDEFPTKIKANRYALSIQGGGLEDGVTWSIVDVTPSKKMRAFKIVPKAKEILPFPRVQLKRDK